MLGALWVYRFSATDWDVYWTVLTCALSSDGELAVDEGTDKDISDGIILRGRKLDLRHPSEVFSVDGRKVFDGKGEVILKAGSYIVRIGNKLHRVVVR